MRRALALVATALLLTSGAASAEVVESHGGGFATRQVAEVDTSVRETWDALVQPSRWWSHTWSGDKANLTLDPRAGGCFCESLPPIDGAFAAGSVEHMHVLTVVPGRVLRMSGALGPLQAEGLVGTLTVTLEPNGEGTRITWDYLVHGEARFPVAEFGPTVDRVQAEFLGELVKILQVQAGRGG